MLAICLKFMATLFTNLFFKKSLVFFQNLLHFRQIYGRCMSENTVIVVIYKNTCIGSVFGSEFNNQSRLWQNNYNYKKLEINFAFFKFLHSLLYIYAFKNFVI